MLFQENVKHVLFVLWKKKQYTYSRTLVPSTVSPVIQCSADCYIQRFDMPRSDFRSHSISVNISISVIETALVNSKSNRSTSVI